MENHPPSFKRTVPGHLINHFKTDINSNYDPALHSKLSAAEQTRCKLILEDVEDYYNNAPCGYHSLDEKGLFVRINNTELKWLGYTREELIGRVKMTDLLTKTDAARFRKYYITLKKEGFVRDREYDLRRKDNSLMPVLMHSSGIFDEKGVLRISNSSVTDLRMQRSAQDKLALLRHNLGAKNNELAKVNENMSVMGKAKDRFIGIAYHDLQNPLAVITLLSKILLSEEVPVSPEKRKETIYTIYEAALQMEELIKNYLNASRIESGSIGHHFAQIDIVRLTKKIIGHYEGIAEEKDIPIFFDSPKKNIIFSDAESYCQVIENLLSNAVKYTPPGKSIFVKIYSKGSSACVEIQDEGVGIKPEEIPRLYDKFQNLSSRPTGGELSTGLGMNIVKFLLDELHGSIKVKSRPGKGTKFIVCLERFGNLYTAPARG